jgi:hypothetical protein
LGKKQGLGGRNTFPKYRKICVFDKISGIKSVAFKPSFKCYSGLSIFPNPSRQPCENITAAGDYLFVLTRYPGIPCIKARDICNKIDGFGGIKFDEVTRNLFIGERDLDGFGLKVYDPATKTTTLVRDNEKYPLPPYSQTVARW